MAADRERDTMAATDSLIVFTWAPVEMEFTGWALEGINRIPEDRRERFLMDAMPRLVDTALRAGSKRDDGTTGSVALRVARDVPRDVPWSDAWLTPDEARALRATEAMRAG